LENELISPQARFACGDVYVEKNYADQKNHSGHSPPDSLDQFPLDSGSVGARGNHGRSSSTILFTELRPLSPCDHRSAAAVDGAI
jgi:hypothetical protein